MSHNTLGNYYQVMRDLKRVHNYSIPEQEEMLPFERDILMHMLQAEAMKEANRPDQGWTKYAEELGVTKKTEYQKNFRVLGG